MALTDIARGLKLTFSGLEAPGYQEEINRFRSIYGDAESIRIGDMDYIVINEVYKSEEYRDVPPNTSPLFFNSIKNNFAIIDAETSSILIDEVYSRVTYMQRDCVTGAEPPSPEKREGFLSGLIGGSETFISTTISNDEKEEESRGANIFQCQLIKDTGVSASHDAYSFMMVKNKPIKEVPNDALKMIQSSNSAVSILDESNRDGLEVRKKEIQEAVFNHYINSDMDIQSISVKSIFEIRLEYCRVELRLKSKLGDNKQNSIYRTEFLSGKNDEFDLLNANIHICNCCKQDLIDARDDKKIHLLFTNYDAYDIVATHEACERASVRKKSDRDKDREKNPDQEPSAMKFSPEHMVYAVGCEDCLTECPECHRHHFDYQKLVGSKIYSNPDFALVPGREFILGLRTFDGINYCACREGIEWVYDERSGSEDAHDVIPTHDMVFVNCANEMMADSERYLEYLQKELSREKNRDAFEERAIARDCLNKFKERLASQFKMKSTGIQITSRSRCHTCYLCGGVYHGVLTNDRCPVCNEMFEEDRRIVTRADGVVFMLSGGKRKRMINKYTVTKLGNLKKIPSKRVYDSFSDTAETSDASPDAAGI